jgi:hypothetical protein
MITLQSLRALRKDYAFHDFYENHLDFIKKKLSLIPGDKEDEQSTINEIFGCHLEFDEPEPDRVYVYDAKHFKAVIVQTHEIFEVTVKVGASVALCPPHDSLKSAEEYLVLHVTNRGRSSVAPIMH